MMMFNSKIDTLNAIKNLLDTTGFKSKKKNEFTKPVSKKPESIFSNKLPFELFDHDSLPIKDCFILRNNQLLNKDIILCPIKVENSRSSIRSIPFFINSIDTNCKDKYNFAVLFYTIKQEFPERIREIYIEADLFKKYNNYLGAFTIDQGEDFIKTLLNNSMSNIDKKEVEEVDSFIPEVLEDDYFIFREKDLDLDLYLKTNETHGFV